MGADILHRRAAAARLGPALGAALLVFACGGGGGGGDGGPTPAPAPPSDVKTSLDELGFDTRTSPRLDADGNPYPTSYSPFGARVRMAQRADGTQVFGHPTELVLAGFGLANRAAGELLSVVDQRRPPPFGAPAGSWFPTVLHGKTEAEAPWLRERPAATATVQTRRDAAAADLDGDGRQELVFAYVGAGGAVRLLVKSFHPAGPPEADLLVPLPPVALPVVDLRVAAGDFNQDGRDEVVLGVVTGTGAGSDETAVARIFILAPFAGGVGIVKALELPRVLPGSRATLVLATGSFDYDGAHELAVVINETAGPAADPTAGAARFHLFDDHATGYALRKTGAITAQANDAQGMRDVTAVVGHVSIGDIDRDQAGEVLLAGLGSFNASCVLVDHLLVVLDDGVRDFRPRTASATGLPVPDCKDGRLHRLRHVFVNVLDLDGDEDLEIQVNQYVFQQAPAASNWDGSPELVRLDQAMFPGSGDQTFDRSVVALAVADTDGDGRAELVVYHQGNDTLLPNNTFRIHVDTYGLGSNNTFGRLARIETAESNPFVRSNPIVVAIQPDIDGQVLEYLGDHELVFTEALVLAALAAPPCGDGIGQNTDACTTTWGKFASIGAESERELTFEAGIAVGFKVQGGALTQSDATSKIKLSAAASFVRSFAYQVSRATNYTTGPMEDSVVFSSTPLDKYTYRVIAHPDPARVGTEVVIGLPRTPVVRIAERSYYNAHLPAGAPRIGDEVFTHRPGDLTTYPDAARKTAILAQMRSQIEDNRTHPIAVGNLLSKLPVFDPLESLTGLQTEAPGVGQGRGATSVSLEVSSENSFARALKLGVEFETKTTVVGVVFDINLGFDATWTFKMTQGAGTSYEGSVGSIDAANFLNHQYRFGLFTYLQPDAQGREFQVVNYWVER